MRISKLVFLSIAFCLGIGCLGCNTPSANKVSAAPEDEIIDRKIFDEVYSLCGATSSSTSARTGCVVDSFTRKADEYCARNELVKTSPKCKEMHEKVKNKVTQYFAENIKDALKP